MSVEISCESLCLSAIIDINMIYLHTLLNISKHRPEQSDSFLLTAALPNMLKLIITEYNKPIATK